MKKILNIALILSIALVSTTAFAKDETKLAKADEQVHIVKPQKTKTESLKKQIKRLNFTSKNKAKYSKEAEGMYVTKFPVIDSKINFNDVDIQQ